jgi:hypothetical protein
MRAGSMRVERRCASALAALSTGWLWLIFESFVLETDWESSIWLLSLGTVLVFSTPVAYLGQLLLLRALLKRWRHPSGGIFGDRALVFLLGPLGAYIETLGVIRLLEREPEATVVPSTHAQNQ